MEGLQVEEKVMHFSWLHCSTLTCQDMLQFSSEGLIQT